MSPETAAHVEPEANHVVSRGRGQTIRTCAFILPNGNPCGQAARRGRALCRLHDPEAKKDAEAKAADSVEVMPLNELVSIDVEDSNQLRTLRRGLLAHVAKRTIDIVTARGMHELAMAMHKDAHSKDGESAFAELARSIAAGLNQPPTPGGEGGNP